MEYSYCRKLRGLVGFWGNYAGAIISGLVTLYVLCSTIAENAKIRESQIKTIKYTQQQTWLENLRRQIIEDYKMLDLRTALRQLDICIDGYKM